MDGYQEYSELSSAFNCSQKTMSQSRSYSMMEESPPTPLWFSGSGCDWLKILDYMASRQILLRKDCSDQEQACVLILKLFYFLM